MCFFFNLFLCELLRAGKMTRKASHFGRDRLLIGGDSCWCQYWCSFSICLFYWSVWKKKCFWIRSNYAPDCSLGPYFGCQVLVGFPQVHLGLDLKIWKCWDLQLHHCGPLSLWQCTWLTIPVYKHGYAPEWDCSAVPSSCKWQVMGNNHLKELEYLVPGRFRPFCDEITNFEYGLHEE